jgi:glycosyltransferase involved in cell wall biosynthesis
MNTYIIASNSPFSVEILKDYPNATLFNPSSEAELANAMRDLIVEGVVLKSAAIHKNHSCGWAKVIRLLDEYGSDFKKCNN